MARQMDVLERRIRPLYEAIDSRNYKQALKIANGVMQKHADSLLVKTLKALTLERMGRMEEALELCTEVKDAGTDDEQVLNTVAVIYRDLGRFDEATKCFELAASKHPKNTDLMVAVFNAYVREHRYAKQQQVAMRLYKARGDDKFLMWAVCSTHLQAKGEKGTMRKQLFQIAEALLRKRASLSSTLDYESLLIYVDVLNELGKHREAVELIDGPLGEVVRLEVDKLRIKGEFLRRLGDHQSASETYKALLEANSDDWVAWQCYLEEFLCPPLAEERSVGVLKASAGPNGCSKEGVGEAATPNDAAAATPNDAAAAADSQACPAKDVAVAEKDEASTYAGDGELPHGSGDGFVEGTHGRWLAAREFVQKLQREESEDMRRGSFLAELELIRRWMDYREKRSMGSNGTCGRGGEDSSIQELLGGLDAAILGYFERFGHLGSFAKDVKLYTSCLPGSVKGELIRALREACNRIAEENPVKSLRRQLNVFHVEEQLGLVFEETDAETVRRAAMMSKLFADTLHLSDDLDAKERGYNEELLCLSVNLLIVMFRRTRDFGYLLESLLLLEQGLSVRRYNQQYALMLLSLYGIVGAPQQAVPSYSLMEVKHIMNDTLSHHCVPGLLSCGRWKEARPLFEAMGRLYLEHSKDSAELLLLVFRHHTYSKIEEFIEFKGRLERSHQRLSMQIEQALIHLKTQADDPATAQAAIATADIDLGRSPLGWCSETQLQQLSFNEDLTARPWWHPSPDECLLVEGDGTWTEARWHVPESDDHRVRREQRWRSAVKRRCLIPRMVWLALSGSSEAGADSAGTGTGNKGSESTAAAHGPSAASVDNANELREHVLAYAKTLGMSEETLEVALENTLSKGGTETDAVTTPARELLFLATFAAASDMLLLVSEVQGNALSCSHEEKGTSTSCRIQRRMRAMTSLLDQVIVEVVDELFEGSSADLCNVCDGSNGEGTVATVAAFVRPGYGVTKLTGFVWETLTWISLCAQSWLRSFPSPKRKKKASGLSEGGAAAVLAGVKSSLQLTTSAMTSSLNKLEGIVQSHLAFPEEDEAKHLLQLASGGHRDGDSDSGALRCLPGEALKAVVGKLNTAERMRKAQAKEASFVNDKGDERVAVEDERPIVKVLDPKPLTVLRRMVKSQREVLIDTHNQLLARTKAMRKLKF